jgi:hypothetical protein
MTGGMAPLAKCLLCQCKALNSNPSSIPPVFFSVFGFYFHIFIVEIVLICQLTVVPGIEFRVLQILVRDFNSELNFPALGFLSCLSFNLMSGPDFFQSLILLTLPFKIWDYRGGSPCLPLIEFFELKKKICGLNSGLHTCYANAITA